MMAPRRFSSEDVRRIAWKLAGNRRISRNGNGLKTFCPLCGSESRRERPRATLSIAARDGQILAYCHRCKREGREIIRELVRLELLPNLFPESSAAFVLAGEVRAAMRAAVWNGTAKATDLIVIEVLLKILERCC
jgi:hypothetical protein